MKYLNIQFLLILISVFIVIHSLFYYLYQTNSFVIYLSLLLSLIISYFLSKKITYIETKKLSLKFDIWLFLFLLHLFLSFFVLFYFRHEQALISPWQAVSPIFFPLYFLTALYLIFYLIKNKISHFYSLVSLISFFLLSFSVNIIIFKLGYGFDPFIHQAALEYIQNFNFILPKTPYYIGYYSLVLLINKLIFIPIALINQIIVPILSALILPIVIYKYNNKDALSTLLALLLGFSMFTLSTPQNLAFLFLIITIFISYKYINTAIILALATVFIHPIAGIPALSFTLLNKLKLKKLILISNILVFPVIFYFFNQTQFSFSSLNIKYPSFFFSNQESLVLNLSYFWYYMAWIFLLIIIVYFFKKLIKNNFILLSLLSFASFYLASLVSQLFIFSDLISYEQVDYSNRLKTVALIFLLPAILKAFRYLSIKLKEKSINYQIIFSITIAVMLTASLYFSYPRLDNYHSSRSFSISRSDIASVNFINDKMKDKYIVLSNQQLAVTALKELGFNNYIKLDNEEIYFYAIPTGGKLYQYYLETVYQDNSYQAIKKAMKYSRVNHGWVAIHQYWWASDKIIEELKLKANEYYNINDDIHLFYFSIK
jgi:hypothetical protein